MVVVVGEACSGTPPRLRQSVASTLSWIWVIVITDTPYTPSHMLTPYFEKNTTKFPSSKVSLASWNATMLVL